MRARVALALAGALLAGGCATRLEQIAGRIGEREAFFAALPEEAQARLRAGDVAPGDAMEAVWIVYGAPDRKFDEVRGAVTNEIWSYLGYDTGFVEGPRMVYYPARFSRGGVEWFPEAWRGADVYEHPYETLRVEFENGRVSAVTAEKR